jgi:hypothetical protein
VSHAYHLCVYPGGVADNLERSKVTGERDLFVRADQSRQAQNEHSKAQDEIHQFATH